MSVSDLFIDGYLNDKYINRSYRGLVGWGCEITQSMGYAGTVKQLESYSNTLLGLRGLDNVFMKGIIFANSDEFKIKEFSPADIPVGELVWLKEYRKEFWVLTVFVAGISNYHIHDKIVPHLIAETAERAEELKDWSKSYE